MMAIDTDKEAVQREIAALGPWFHNLHLPCGAQTAPEHWLGDFPQVKWEQLAPHLPDDLHGWSALDVGCNAGFYSFELARRGAHVTGIDVNPHYLRQACWAQAHFGCADQTDFRCMQVYDLAHADDEYDLVLFLGVLYHLRYPLLGLDILAQKTRRMMVFQTLTMPGDPPHGWADPSLNDRELLTAPDWPKLAFIEDCFNGDPTNWWLPNPAAVEAMLRSAGMRIVATPGHEIHLCEPDRDHPLYALKWDEAELLSATGRTKQQTQS